MVGSINALKNSCQKVASIWTYINCRILRLYTENPAHGRQRISRPMRIVGPTPFWRGCKIYLQKKNAAHLIRSRIHPTLKKFTLNKLFQIKMWAKIEFTQPSLVCLLPLAEPGLRPVWVHNKFTNNNYISRQKKQWNKLKKKLAGVALLVAHPL